MIHDDYGKKGTRPHCISLEDRERLSITGVEDVESFDDTQIVLRTCMGSLILRGSELHIERLTLESGEMSITGLITDISYEETAPAGSLWQRLFR